MGIDQPLTRTDIVRDQLEHPPLGSMRRDDAGPPVRAGVSGSGGDLLVLAWSATELACERAAGVRLFKRLGIGQGTRVANALPGALATPGSLMLGDVVQDLGGLDIPVGAIENEAAAKAAWTLIDLVEPEVLVLNAPSASQLFAAAPEQARPWWKGIVWLQTDTSADAAAAVPVTARFKGWQRIWLAVPEVTSFLAISCSAAALHLDSAIVAEELSGVIALTPVNSETTIKRYVSSLRGQVSRDTCTCGADGPTLTLEGGANSR